MQTITRKLEFDAGHRIPDHRSQCRNLHGHRYVLEITLQGELVETEGAPDRGMVMDFADVKALAMEHLVNKWDHAFIVYARDEVVRSFLEKMADHKTVVLDRIPTVENLAAEAFRILSSVYNDHYGVDLKLKRVRLYETPNCWADVEGV
ncbi:6-pyruvoyl tetrahydropterin synthase [Caballeronia sp. SBC1]|uniref:6-carboxytetrahydropterin synthase QueD n=1 Tax=unclassified Caballeronia TaxID=2646786 RepID=UPI0013E1C412|nr:MULTISPECIES: 6-carboxytetrahydropterin synthase QueD [unclassified Caballeronia]QIE22047.1 6-pyruvoyl tetrahydropterin synthase [Caballeronia sp. SBC2]QIN60087.1 6-pyruvoyl tetrahydropterin synthase [Caballeronia sp. SBC1]